MNPVPLKGKNCDNCGRYAKDYIEKPNEYHNKFTYEDVKSAVAGLIQFHEDRIEELISKIENISPPEFIDTILDLNIRYSLYNTVIELMIYNLQKEYESIMAIEHRLEDVI